MNSRGLLIVLIGLTSCVSEFERGSESFDNGELVAAKAHFMLVRQDEDHYQDAQIMIMRIDTLESVELSRYAVSEYAIGRSDDALTKLYEIRTRSIAIKTLLCFRLLDSIANFRTSEYDSGISIVREDYPQSQVELQATDSISTWWQASSKSRSDLCILLVNAINRRLQVGIAGADLQSCIEQATRGIDEANDLTIVEVTLLCASKLARRSNTAVPIE